jgi:hypothetical protein
MSSRGARAVKRFPDEEHFLQNFSNKSDKQDLKFFCTMLYLEHVIHDSSFELKQTGE